VMKYLQALYILHILFNKINENARQTAISSENENFPYVNVFNFYRTTLIQREKRGKLGSAVSIRKPGQLIRHEARIFNT
jgi:hypothetical protein